MQSDPTPTDEQLMQEVGEGALQQLNTLFRRYHPILNAFFIHMGSDAQTAQDLTQETFLRILRFRCTFKAGLAFKPWMFRIAKNVRHDHMRKLTRSPQPAAPQPIHESYANALEDLQCDPAPPANELQQQKEDISQLNRALQLLEPQHREILFLARYEQLNYNQIAQSLGCSANNVKIRVYRALEKLKKSYHQLSERMPTA